VRLAELDRRLRGQHPRARIGRDRKRLEALTEQLRVAGRELVTGERRRLRALDRRLRAAGHALPRRARVRLARATGALDALSPLAVLARGYAVVTDATGHAITRADELAVDTDVDLRLHRGRARGRITAVEPED
jgi:exodeoxyribonuclease VII large subunit